MQSGDRRIRTAIVGFGVSGELSHAYGLSHNPHFEIVAVCDLREERRNRAKDLLGCDTYGDHREMLAADRNLDLAAIITRSDTHCSLACDFLESGVNTLITKPWVTSTEEAEAVIAAQARSGKQVFPWIPMYWSPEYKKIKELVNEDAIGKVFMIRRHVSQFKRRDDWQTQSKFGGGCLLNWGSHIIHPILDLADEEISSVTGHLQQVIDPGDVEDNFHATIHFENGVTGIAEYTQAIEGLPSFMIQGSKGTILSDGKQIVLIQNDPSYPESTIRESYTIEGKIFGDEIDVYRDVARSLAENKPFRASVQDAYRVTSITDAIKRSHREKRTITLSLSAMNSSDQQTDAVR